MRYLPCGPQGGSGVPRSSVLGAIFLVFVGGVDELRVCIARDRYLTGLMNGRTDGLPRA